LIYLTTFVNPANMAAFVKCIFLNHWLSYKKGRMVRGQTQFEHSRSMVDAAFVEANASINSLKRKTFLEWQLLLGKQKK
jgi:hypothetical protein